MVSVERLDNLERVVIKLEGSVSTLTEKMGDVAASLQTMSQALSKLALYDVKIQRIEKDITNVASSVRTTNKRIDELHTEHSKACETNLNNLDEKGVKRFRTAVSLTLGILTVAFGYLYKDIESHQTTDTIMYESVKKIDVKLAKIDGRIDVLNEKLKKANGHRYYLTKEIKDELTRKH